MSILTYNVKGNSIKKDEYFGTRNHKILQFVKKQDPDIVVFQEFWNYGFVKYYMYPYRFVGYRSEISKSLQFILSKYPIIKQGYIDFPNTLNNAMFVDIDYEGEVFRLYNIHLQSFNIKIASELSDSKKAKSIFYKISNAQNLRRNQVKLIQSHEKEFEGKTIFCGDFNSTPFSSTYQILKGSRKDTYIEAGSGLGTTYSLIKYPLRLDYILADKDFEVISHQNFNINLSDHEPILARLDIN
ncbi:hypothetical protein GCM10023311_04800 [Flaviramulus aquimarinus]|uniref:Endonuclease/exonuclease/phosphatase domain-containing protein n=1 Tax=Flaviramulus aquimarinus TaxID=1170456 RepID=A0ABP9F0D2_9FLAO